MNGKRWMRWSCTAGLVALAMVGLQVLAHAQGDPVLAKIIQLGTTDNQVMTWNDYASNRFGGRETGTNAYTDATEWAVWQLRQWGFEAQREEVGEMPVGFNRGPWFGRMVKPAEKALRFGTPTYTAGTKGVQAGGVVILKADPFSISGRSRPGQVISKENADAKRAAVQAALAEIAANRSAFAGKWVLIAGTSTGFARDGRRGTKLPDGTPEYLESEVMPPLTAALVSAGALGTIQAAKDPIQIMDGFVPSWDKLPVLPDIKLLDTQYTEIKEMVQKNQPVELEFDIRNWFKMGPIKYHNVVATIRGTQYPDEYVVIGGHFDCFSGGTGGVDDGSGFAPGMEAARLIKAAGAHPKRSIVLILFAAEENGLVGSQAWLKSHPDVHAKIVMMVNRDGSPSAITGATVPESWYEDFRTITAPLATLNPKWPFKLEKGLPRAHATSPGGTDSSSFEMQGVPTLNFATTRGYNYGHAWHTLYDTYSELVPFTEHQKHSALATAVVVYGVANLDKPLAHEGVYLADGLYAAITVGDTDAPKRVMVSLDYGHAPVQTADFIRIVEGKTPLTGPAGPPPGVMGGPGGPQMPPPIGSILEIKGGMIPGLITSDVQRSVAVPKLPKTRNTALRHDVAGVLGMSSPNSFYLTLKKNTGLDGRYTAIGKVIAGLDALQAIRKGDAIGSIRIIRVGEAARSFKTDDEAFGKLMGPAPKKK